MKKIILILGLIICFIFNSVSIYASEIETTQVNTEEVIEDFPALMIDIYNTVPYKMENGDIIYLPELLDEYPVWAIYKKDSYNYCIVAVESITYKADGSGVVISNGLNYKFNNNSTFDSFYTANNLMYVSGSHGTDTSYGSAAFYCTGEFYSIYNLLDTDGNVARSANLVKVTEEDPDVPVDPDPEDPEDPDVPVDPEDPEDPEDPVVDNTELTEAIKENNSILNRIYKVLNNLFIMYLFFNTLPFVTTIAKRLSGKEFK